MVTSILSISIALWANIALNQEESLICWKEDHLLKWSDFQGIPDHSSPWNAVCAASIKVVGYWDSGLPNFEITNCFDKKMSWTKDTTSISSLTHEQLHFDIAEIHARKMRKAVDSLRMEGVNGFDQYSIVVRSILGMRNKVDSLFDLETAHGIYEDQQELWFRKTREDLGQSREFGQRLSKPPE